MPRIVCPKCGHVVKISSSGEQTRVRCVECSYRIPVLEAEEYNPKKHKKKKPHPALKYLVWIPVVAATLFGLPLALFSQASPIAGSLAGVLAGVALVGGIGWGAFYAAEDGGYVGFDYLNLAGSFNLILLILFIGLLPLILGYLIGYVVYLLFTQIQFSFRRPMRYAPIQALEAFGLLLVIITPILYLRGESNREQRRFEQRQAEVKQREEDAKLHKDKRNNVRDTGDPALDKLLTDLVSKDAAVRKAASDELSKMPPNQHQAVVADFLGLVATSSDFQESQTSIRPLTLWATEKEVPRLVQVYDKEPTAGTLVLQAFARLKDPRSVEPLLKRNHPILDQTQIDKVIRDMGPVAESGVLACTNSASGFGTQRRAVVLLKDVGTERSVERLQSLSMDMDTEVRRAAKEALSAIEARAKK